MVVDRLADDLVSSTGSDFSGCLTIGLVEKNDEMADRPEAILFFFGLSFFTGVFFSCLTVTVSVLDVPFVCTNFAGFASGLVFSFFTWAAPNNLFVGLLVDAEVNNVDVDGFELNSFLISGIGRSSTIISRLALSNGKLMLK